MTLFFPSRTPSCSLIFPLALFSNIETENLPVSVQEILGKKLRGIRYPHFPVGFTPRQKHNLQSKSSQIISWEGKKRQLILILSCISSPGLQVLGFNQNVQFCLYPHLTDLRQIREENLPGKTRGSLGEHLSLFLYFSPGGSEERRADTELEIQAARLFSPVKTRPGLRCQREENPTLLTELLGLCGL